jgi:hypothetical protein
LLDSCCGVLEEPVLSLGGDEFPKLAGRHRGRRVHAELIPDTMTIKRLPQLWLSVTLLQRLPGISSFAVLVRPSGNDFYSLTESFRESLIPPPGLPWEVLIRGETSNAQAHLDHLAGLLSAILSDPRVKEVAVTARGLRIVLQAGEGRRGEHLLLRQAVFDDAGVGAAQMRAVLVHLDALASRMGVLASAEAA